MKLEMKLVKLALLSPMHPLTTAKESGSELILPAKRQWVPIYQLSKIVFRNISHPYLPVKRHGVPPVVRLSEIWSVVLSGSLISSRLEFNHVTLTLTVASSKLLTSSSFSASYFSSFLSPS